MGHAVGDAMGHGGCCCVSIVEGMGSAQAGRPVSASLEWQLANMRMVAEVSRAVAGCCSGRLGSGDYRAVLALDDRDTSTMRLLGSEFVGGFGGRSVGGGIGSEAAGVAEFGGFECNDASVGGVVEGSGDKRKLQAHLFEVAESVKEFANVERRGVRLKPKGAGEHWERNVANRKKKKENKKERREKFVSVDDCGEKPLKNNKKKKPVMNGVGSFADHCEPKSFSPVPEWRRGAGGIVPGSSDNRGFFASLSGVEKEEMLRSRAKMFTAQNELAVMKAERQAEILRRNDVSLEVQKYRTKISSEVEKNMVAIEQTHAHLVKTGNVPGSVSEGDSSVPGFVSGSVETLVSSGTISPNSSVSEAEVRKMQKDLLDKDAQLEKVSVFLERTMGVNMKYMDLYEKEEWTDTPENMEILAEMFPEGNYVVMPLSYDDKRFTVRRFGS